MTNESTIKTTQELIEELNTQACDPKRSVVVEACAGSGKTWLLISRIFRLLLEGEEPHKILAITFTRKAAQEMNERLEKLLKEMATESDDWVIDQLKQRGLTQQQAEEKCPQAKQLFERVLANPQKISIDTFHGWFSRLSAVAPITSDIISQGNVREDRDRLLKEALEQWWILLGSGEGKFKYLQEQYVALSKILNTKDIEKMLTGAASMLDQQMAWQQYLQGLQKETPIQRLSQYLPAFQKPDPLKNCADPKKYDWEGLQDCYNWYSQSEAPSDKTLSKGLLHALNAQKRQASDEECVNLLIEALRNKGDHSVSKPNVRQCSGELKKILKREKKLELVDVIPEKFKAWTDKLDEQRKIIQDQQMMQINQAWIDLGESLVEHVAQYKKNHRFMDFNDLESNVLKLLRDDTYASYIQARLDAKYRHILIDEFQDTSPLQWSILKSWLAAYGNEDRDKPSIFVVGDPKQSIYRFRKADVRLFEEVQNYLSSKYSAVTLRNDRTRRNPQEVVDVVNATFLQVKELLKVKEDSDQKDKQSYLFEKHETLWVNPKETPLETQAFALELVHAEIPEHEVENRNPLEHPMRDDLHKNAPYQSFEEASQVAKIIRHWMNTRQVLDKDAKGGIRLAKESDFFILLRTSTHIQQVEKALRLNGLAYISPRKGGLLKTLEAEDIVALLRVLLTPSNQLALAHVLRTPIFNCSEAELQYLAHTSDQTSWWPYLDKSPAYPNLIYAHQKLTLWCEKAKYLPVHDLLDFIYQDGKLFEVYTRDCPPLMQAKVIANLEAFLKLALDVNGGRYPSLSRLIDELTILSGGTERETPSEGEVSEDSEESDDTEIETEEQISAVRIMTIHSAKGLEAPFVFLMQANSPPKDQDTAGLLCEWPTSQDHPQNMFVYHKSILNDVTKKFKEEEARIDEIEKYNLLYVAMTRAKQCLVITGSGKKEHWWYALLKQSGIEIKTFEQLVPSTQELPSNDQQTPASPILKFAQLTPLELSSDWGQKQDDEPDSEGDENHRQPTKEQILGTAVHQILERLTTEILPEDYQIPESNQLANWLEMPEDIANEARKMAIKILQSNQLKPYFYSQDIQGIWNEMDILQEKKLYRIDRLVELPNELIILDYKLTIPAKGSEGLQKYQDQLNNYRDIIGKLRNDKKIRCILVDYEGQILEVF
jgi:ATP-dependent helicase/nuclease subunit A